MSGKGSSPRPYSVDRKTYEDNWDRIFSNTKKSPEIICPKCGVDRAKNPCPGPIMNCPLVGESQNEI